MKGMLLFLYIPKLCENKALVRKNQSQQYLVDCLAFCQCTGVRRQNGVSDSMASCVIDSLRNKTVMRQ